jgi:hypothetical protein
MHIDGFAKLLNAITATLMQPYLIWIEGLATCWAIPELITKVSRHLG